MARPIRIQFPGAFYHVTSRAYGRKAIFKDDQDRAKFLTLLSQSCATYNVNLHSFVLLNNHFHILVETPMGNLGNFMRHFNITYTTYFNKRHKRIGHLYHGRYKSLLIDKDNYLAAVSRYIHLNPVKVGPERKYDIEQQLKHLWSYKWSSLPGFIWKKKRLEFMNYKTVLEQVGGNKHSAKKNYQKQIALDLEKGLPLRKNIVSQCLLGDEAFVSEIRQQFLTSRQARTSPQNIQNQRYLDKKVIFQVVSKHSSLTPKLLLSSKGTNRNLIMAMLYKYSSLNNRQIGELFGIDYSTVSLGRKNLLQETESNKKTNSLVKKIEKKLAKRIRNLTPP